MISRHRHQKKARATNVALAFFKSHSTTDPYSDNYGNNTPLGARSILWVCAPLLSLIFTWAALITAGTQIRKVSNGRVYSPYAKKILRN